MTETQDTLVQHGRQQWQGLTLADYVNLRNGVPLGASGSLQNMLRRSLGASSFAEFWQYWNPIWGYGLGKHVYSPLRRFLPAALAAITTFVVSGLIHDAVIMGIRRSFTLLLTPWFFLLGLGLVLGRAAGMDLSGRPWWMRAGANLLYLGGCFILTLAARRVLGIP